MQYGYSVPNIFAPPAYNGLGAGSPDGFLDQAFSYVYNVTVPLNGTVRENLITDADADFIWRALTITDFTSINFSLQFTDSDWYQHSSGAILAANYQGDAASPFAVVPEITIPAGGRIGIETNDLSGAENTIQLVLRGVKRFKSVTTIKAS